MKRLNYDANTKEDTIQYYQTRARQILSDGFVWDRSIIEIDGGLETGFLKDGKVYKSFYIYKDSRGKGVASKALSNIKEPIVTVPDCHIEDFLKAKGKEYVLGGDFIETEEYKAIQSFYGDDRAERSQCYKMNHIDEGLYIMHLYGATENAKKAFCVHPIIQNDLDLAANWETFREQFSPTVVGLAMEYRNIANAYLSHREISSLADIQLSPLKEVNDMLIADKVQNYKDFIIYHSGTHKRKKELDKYFNDWLQKLNISKERFVEIFYLLKAIEQ
jgi:hypothetical protein